MGIYAVDTGSFWHISQTVSGKQSHPVYISDSPTLAAQSGRLGKMYAGILAGKIGESQHSL